MPEETSRDQPSPVKLTHRQFEVTRFLCSTGLSYKEIAARLEISAGTMRKHVENIYRCLGVHSRAELMLLWCTVTPSNFTMTNRQEERKCLPR